MLKTRGVVGLVAQSRGQSYDTHNAVNEYCANGIVPGTGTARELANYFASNDEETCAFRFSFLERAFAVDALNAFVSRVAFPIARLKTRVLG